MGAQIEGIDSDVLTIHGVRELQPANYTIMSDRIEAGTYLAAGAITGAKSPGVKRPGPAPHRGDGQIHRGRGAPHSATKSSITVHAGGSLTGVDIRTHPYPGFPRYMQAQFMALMSVAGRLGTQ